MKITIAALFFGLMGLPFIAAAQNTYNYTVDILNIKDDEVEVILTTPAINEETVTFSFPKAIPGSYANKDFGRFIKDFKAYDAKGKTLKVEKVNTNQFRILKAKLLRGLRYHVNDSWDTNYPNFIFQPGGSNIDAGKNVVMNNHAFFGYFEGYQTLPINIEITKPASFFASTHLQIEHASDEKDLIAAKNYNYLADNPVLYSMPDTTSFLSGNTRINVSVYSVNKKVNSLQVAEYLKPLSNALAKFFNGLPVESYQFLFYFEDPESSVIKKGDGGFGALEHNYSSLYFLPEIALESRLKSMVNEVAGHEFLHIQTPLNLHSEEIENFDFINPSMSQHLWLYEGVTEYFANLVQLQNKLLDKEEFFRNMRQKLTDAVPFGAFSMTEMSKKVLTEEYKSKYNSVYSKGALIGLTLDLFIRQKTNNTKDLKQVIQSLAKKYGPNKPFKDDALFDDLVQTSHPEVAGFVEDYIKGSKPLPVKEMLATIGYDYEELVTKTTYNIGGNFSLVYDEPTKQFVFKNMGNNAITLRSEDALVSIENIAVTGANLDELWEKYIQYNYTLPEITLTINRAGTERVLKGKLFKGSREVKHYLAPVENPTEAQQKNLAKLLQG